MWLVHVLQGIVALTNVLIKTLSGPWGTRSNGHKLQEMLPYWKNIVRPTSDEFKQTAENFRWDIGDNGNKTLSDLHDEFTMTPFLHDKMIPAHASDHADVFRRTYRVICHIVFVC